ncbi:hypothetical protein AcW1_000424 [Taiwanofungus camphoratus]|nr:hypothetical protein AcW2_001079 [Antrodia cinnamomea]KAI0936101.1 hypothetical protein AcV5_004325 [Antrodia cinnamomea]KAI0961309.1 hypothetical protein AcV7_000444 [Antrodia cinnamomea]KAI0963314.1 hypothetical protein AcW1_000424 [Antrodia cinnamomea]
MDTDKYDEYVRGAAREVVTVNTRIKSSNKGFAMLASMGWVEGQPLGLSGDGRVDPVPFYVKNDLTGLGKVNQDVRMIEETVAQRRELDSERQTKETEEQRRAREDSVAKRAAVQSEISTTLRAFYCQLCDKQFQNVAQYDEHTNSYAHHHKARFRDMQAAQRASRNSKEELDKRKEKERKREEKELRKIAKAAGVKMVKPPVSVIPSSTQPSSNDVGSSELKSSGYKKSGWASISSSMSADSASTGVASGYKKPGWASLGATTLYSSSPLPSAESSGPAAPQQTPSDASLNTATGSSSSSGPAPIFRTGGWTSLDTGSTVPAPPAPATPPLPGITRLPAIASTSITLPNLSNEGQQPSNGWNSLSTPQLTPVPLSDYSGVSGNTSTLPLQSPPTVRPKAPLGQARQEVSRSGWQQFRAGAPGRRR